ncbi:MAG TPA: TrbI/VirB10 family protein [Novosphingobium sp.]|nr:TrbI/VirB10 family protein [Novosphingobium sp.]
MRLARNNEVVTGKDFDPRQQESAEVIELATRRVLPQVMERRPRSDTATLLVGVALTCALGAVTFWSMNSARSPQLQPQQPGVIRNDLPAAGPAPYIGVAPAHMTPLAPSMPMPMPGQQTAIMPAPVAHIGQQPGTNPAGAPTLIYDAAANGGPATGLVAPTAGGVAAGGDDFASKIGAGGSGAAKAAVSIVPATTIAQGTLIPAVLETAINTDLPGYARAVVSADVRSFDGSRVLLPRSTRLIGQYKSGIQAGQKRAYVIWTRVIRPDGVSVDIGSPGIDFSGQTGLAGKVNTHFFERFGSAMLLSVVGGLSSLGSSAAIIAGGGQSAAAAAVGQTGQIGPTVRVPQGEPIRVFTARDLDFSKVDNN